MEKNSHTATQPIERERDKHALGRERTGGRAGAHAIKRIQNKMNSTPHVCACVRVCVPRDKTVSVSHSACQYTHEINT